jgi:hypothetical protein
MAIHIKYKIKEIVIGFFQNNFQLFNSYIDFNKKMRRSPANNGSVGRLTDNRASKLLRFMESGVDKAINKKIVSIEKKYR